ncbi:ExbD/TolR family protein [Kangiella sediminilitoris]|uniref:Biopolymer transport protein ExbD/TolR n=1 Tax=Kangiella sediminilitoris TaxID=1144748 RepID=A0A1B3B8J6_9GAMM|nr:biopolymer transporter ExbD [Kangiella sediminilitoris]AOE49105.1 Biopolymer transport protein ExbD/TolR [Kangiella sediminilitoris]
MARLNKKHHNYSADSQTDMTPMLDIVFILLLFFVVTTSFVNTQSIDITQPSRECQQDCDAKVIPLVVTIDEQNQVSFDNRIIDIEAIQANLESQLVKDRQAPVIVKIHGDAQNVSMVSAVDQANKAGALEVSVAAWH